MSAVTALQSRIAMRLVLILWVKLPQKAFFTTAVICSQLCCFDAPGAQRGSVVTNDGARRHGLPASGTVAFMLSMMAAKRGRRKHG